MIILAWNRDIPASWDEYEKAVEACQTDGFWVDAWSVGRRRNIPEGIECFLLSQGKTHPRGLLGRGIVLSEPYPDASYRNFGDVSMYVDVMFTQMLPVGEIVPISYLVSQVDGIPWAKGIRGSGYSVRDDIQPTLVKAWETMFTKLS